MAITKADERLEDTANHTEAAFKALSEIVVNEIPGSTDYNSSTSLAIRRAYIALMDLHNNKTLRAYRHRTGRTVKVETNYTDGY